LIRREKTFSGWVAATGEERAQGTVETRYARTPLVFVVHRAIETSSFR
jgi:hypothetical protein